MCIRDSSIYLVEILVSRQNLEKSRYELERQGVWSTQIEPRSTFTHFYNQTALNPLLVEDLLKLDPKDHIFVQCEKLEAIVNGPGQEVAIDQRLERIEDEFLVFHDERWPHHQNSQT
eukprot:TRINITY_DN28718_c0_g1_i1.p2 TRINITY_DN28718_c0_g1~~TRINITY_DN28718_c0_g1_i1.p2  ORF type:complete len:137 (-),score=8.87 TRINITY_DN28718_c0_g1_i1:180-530(-)